MEHFFKICFWIFSYLACHQAFPTSKLQQPIKEDFRLEFIRNEVTCPSNSTFYTPTNFETRCITDGLECLKDELEKVSDECGYNDLIIISYTALEKLIEYREQDGNAPTNSTDCTCENNAKRPFDEFLMDFESWVQFHFSSNKSPVARADGH